MYKLKPNFPDFEVVDGAFAGRKYEAGKTYYIVPPEEAYKFMLGEIRTEACGTGYKHTITPGKTKEDNNQ